MSSTSDENVTNSLSESEDLEENYYSILNVSRDATDKEITQSYHRLGLIYHPDKHKDPENKKNAELLFSKIKKVYDVLINPHKRAIYDSVGLKGLLQDDLQLVVRSKTPQEIREEYERLSREKEERNLEKLTVSEGSFSMVIDATKVFDDYSITDQNSSLLSVSSFDMLQSIDFPMSNIDTVTLSGNLNTSNKLGNGSVSTTLRRTLSSDTQLDFKGTIGSNKSFSITAIKRLTQKCNFSINALLKYKNGSISPYFNNSIYYRLDDHLVGQLQYKTNLGFTETSMSTSLIYEKENFNVNIRFQLSIKNTYLRLAMSKQFMDNDFKLKSSLQYGYLGATLSYGIEKQVTKLSRVDASITVNSYSGVALNLELRRASQSFMVPIHLSHEIVPSAIFYGTVTPLLAYYIVKKLVIDPYLKNKEEFDAKRKQERLKSEMSERKRLAMAAQNLMKETVARILEKEGSNGLIITKALYGKIPDKNSVSINDKVIDVKIPLQFLVIDKTLQIVSDQKKSSLEGFYDPCIGESKSLYIEYNFNGESYRALFNDNDIIRLPKLSHKLQWWSRPFVSVKN